MTGELAGDDGLDVVVGDSLVTGADDEPVVADIEGLGAMVLGESAVLVEHPASAQISTTEVRATEIRLVMGLATPPSNRQVTHPGSPMGAQRDSIDTQSLPSFLGF